MKFLEPLFSADLLRQILRSSHVFAIADLREVESGFSFFSPAGVLFLLGAFYFASELLALPSAQSCTLARLAVAELEPCGPYFWMLFAAFSIVGGTGIAVSVMVGREFSTIRLADHIIVLFLINIMLLGSLTWLDFYKHLLVPGYGDLSENLIVVALNLAVVLLLLDAGRSYRKRSNCVKTYGSARLRLPRGDKETSGINGRDAAVLGVYLATPVALAKIFLILV